MELYDDGTWSYAAETTVKDNNKLDSQPSPEDRNKKALPGQCRFGARLINNSKDLVTEISCALLLIKKGTFVLKTLPAPITASNQHFTNTKISTLSNWNAMKSIR